MNSLSTFFSGKNRTPALCGVFLFVSLTIWWIYINFLRGMPNDNYLQVWAAAYQVVALYGAVLGLSIAKRWGGYKSYMGKTILALSIGLLLQSFGQSVYSYFIFFKQIEIPYPSIGDIGFFGTVFAYIIAVYYLAKTLRIHVSQKIENKKKVWALFLPIAALCVSYFVFLTGYDYSASSGLKIFLDFGYPLGQAFYVSVAVLILLFSRGAIGGMMYKPVILFLIALCAQYVADFTFLYQSLHGNWYAGGLNDYIYLVSYFLMASSLVYINGVFSDISKNE